MNFSEMYTRILDEHRQVYDSLELSSLRLFIKTVKSHNRIFLIGVGREGLATRAFAMRLMHMGKEIHWIWDDTTPSIGQGDLVIATLGDGEIGHLEYVCERAKEAGGTILIVTGSPSGRTASSIADQILFIPASVYRGKDEVVSSFQPMGNLFEQCLLIVFDIAVMIIVEETEDLTFKKMSMRHRNIE